MGCTGAAAASQQDSGSPSPTGTAQDAACGDSGGDSDTCGFASAGIDGKLALVFSCTRPAQTHPRQVSDARNLPRESSNSHMVPAAPGGQSPVAGAASPHRSMIRRALVNTSTARRGPSQEKGARRKSCPKSCRGQFWPGAHRGTGRRRRRSRGAGPGYARPGGSPPPRRRRCPAARTRS